MDVGVADAAILNVECNIMRTDGTSLDTHFLNGRFFVLDAKGDNLAHGQDSGMKLRMPVI